VNGGHGEPNTESRLAELSMGRQTNSRLNRRQVQQANVGSWAWSKKDMET
jgi:hypothetical protein